MENRPPWSDRRRRTLLGLALGILVFALGGIVLPARYGISSAFLAALCALLLVVATVVFLTIPGPRTFDVLLRTVPLAGAVLVVAILLLLSTSASLRWLWSLIAITAAGWTAFAVWETRRTGG